jgi:uncharacterized protein (DUF58 family)
MAVQTFLEPRTLDALKNVQLIARTLVEGALTGLHRSPYHGFSSEFSEYRKYCPGDPVRHVDWVAFAKSDRYYVKQYEDETNTRTYLALDCSASMGLSRKFNYACYLAAAFIWLAHLQKDAAGLFTFADRILDYVPARGAMTHTMELLARIENLKPAGKSDMAPCFHRMAEEVHRRSLVLVFSDFLEASPEFLKGLRQFQHKGCEVILFQVLDPLETKFPYRGLLEFRDLETGESVELEGEDCRGPYLADLATYLETLRKFCGRMNMEFETLDTAMPFERALLAYFHKRERMV